LSILQIFIITFTFFLIFFPVMTTDISQNRLLFGFFLLYTDCVPFELLDSAQPFYEGRAAVEGGK
jgi:hypothetical protein